LASALFLVAGSGTLAAQEAPVADRPEPALPAVDRLNFTLSGQVGEQGGYGNDMLLGTLAIPLGHPFGLQLDVGAGRFDDDYKSEAGAFHLFWRNPTRAMVGFYGDWGYINPEHAGRVGFEGSYYFERVTLDILVGVNFGQHVDTQGFDEIDLAYYFTDNFKGTLGHRSTTRGQVANIGFEYMPAQAPNWSVYGQAEAGEDDNHSVFAGVRYEFGSKRQPTLIETDRQSRLPIRVPRNIVNVTRCGKLPEAKPATFWRKKMNTMCASRNDLKAKGADEGKL